MKQIAILSLLLCWCVGANANVMFGSNTENAFTLYVSQGTGSGSLLKLIQPGVWDIIPMTNFVMQYSQPMQIMRLDGRMNVAIVSNLGYHSAHGLSFNAVGVSWDVAYDIWNGFYVGFGIGPYMRDSRDRWVESRLVFGERVFIGKNITDRLRTEISTLHFSNGDFTPVNRGFNLAGLGISYSF